MSSMTKGWTTAGVLAGSLAMVGLVLAAAPAGAQSKLSLEARGGVAIPAGDLDEVGEPGGGFGVGLGWRLHDRLTLRADGDLEVLSEALAGTVVMPRTYLWHYHAGLELALTNPSSGPWSIRLRGGAGGTTYDTERFFEGGDDFLDTYFSVSGGLSLGYAMWETVEVGVLGQAFVTFAEKERTAELAERSPAVLNAFREASSFPLQLFLRWRP